jgi:hypothetical protein
MARVPYRQAQIRIDAGDGDDKVVVTFGRVRVEAIRADPQVREANVRAGQEVMARAIQRLSSPGVRFQKKRGVASYRADPKNPRQVIRELMGKTETGVFEDGEFKAIP